LATFAKISLFVVVSMYIIWISRESLRDFRAHGFYRFFAWEAILALILINIDYWFVDPLSWYQIIAWILLLFSLYMLVQGFRLLRSGKTDETRDDPALLELEKTAQLVTTGIYRYIRHPLYSSLLFLTWGALFKHISWIGILLSLIATIALNKTALIEEVENIDYWGAEYEKYMQRTKKFIPLLY